MKYLEQFPSWVNWGLAFPLVALNGWLLITTFNYFHDLITVFLTATLVAFILNYPVRFLTTKGLNRAPAVFLTILLALLTVILIGVTLAPIVIEQLNELTNRLPSWIESGGQQLQTLSTWSNTHNLPFNLSGIANQLTERLSSQLQSLTGKVLNLILETLTSFFSLIFTLVLVFYLLLYGENIWQGICSWLPQPFNQKIRPLLRRNFHKYYVGQASLAAIIGTSITIAFLLLKVPFGLLFGLGVGFMGLFPFGAVASICLVGLLVALKSFWLGVRVLVLSILLEQAIENVVAPRILGGFTGLNPVWILFSLFLAAKLAGVLGLLVAVPLAAFIKGAALALADKSPSYEEAELIEAGSI